jgi:hypothetical protein
MATVLTSAQLRDLLATLLEGAAGGSREAWLRAIGEVERLPLYSNPVSNWRVQAGGSATERDAIARAVEIVRNEHPYVTG